MWEVCVCGGGKWDNMQGTALPQDLGGKCGRNI